MKKIILITGIVIHIFSCNNADTTNTDLTTKIDSVSYSLGVSIANNLKGNGFDTIQLTAISSAFNDVFSENDLLISKEDADAFIREYFAEMAQKKNQKAYEKGQAFLDENAKNEGVITTSSGLQYQVLKEGTGAKPSPTDRVTVHYHGTLIDGTVFDSSVDRGEPATFDLSGVIQGWVEGIQLMSVGSKYKLFVPTELAYAERGAGGVIGPNEALIFEVELLSIN